MLGAQPRLHRRPLAALVVLRGSATWASTIAPSAAVISSAEVSSNAKRYLVKISCAMPGTLPLRSVAPAARPTGVTSVSARPTAADQQHGEPEAEQQRGDPLAAQHLDDRVGASRPTSISTNRNSIMIAPV